MPDTSGFGLYRIRITREGRWFISRGLLRGGEGRSSICLGLKYEHMSDRIHCDLCGRDLSPQGHYIVRIDVFADPALPAVSGQQVNELDFDATLKELIAEMEGLSADDLQDQVHRRFEYHICRPCQMRFLANPLGKPRTAMAERSGEGRGGN